ncbi:hypothetical protein Vretimale_1329, partial [Volvox reticuliferus]
AAAAAAAATPRLLPSESVFLIPLGPVAASAFWSTLSVSARCRSSSSCRPGNPATATAAVSRPIACSTGCSNCAPAVNVTVPGGDPNGAATAVGGSNKTTSSGFSVTSDLAQTCDAGSLPLLLPEPPPVQYTERGAARPAATLGLQCSVPARGNADA